MLAFVTDIFSRGFRKPKPAPLNKEPGPGNNGSGAGGGGNFGSPSTGLIPGSPSSQRVTQKPLFLCKPFVTSQLVKGSFSTIVVLPRYVDQGEWLALNRVFPPNLTNNQVLPMLTRSVFEFFDMLNKFYGVVQEFCTPQACPSMSAGPGYDYISRPRNYWLDLHINPLPR